MENGGGGGIQLQAPLLFYMGKVLYKISRKTLTSLNRPALFEAGSCSAGDGGIASIV